MIHIYAAGHQPATRFNVGPLLENSKRGHWVKIKSRALVWCGCCKRRRIAKNCTVQAYYDNDYFWCKRGKGCKA